jgi:PEP-CTERM motif
LILKSLILGMVALASSAFAAPINTGTGGAPWLVNGNPAVVETSIASPFWIGAVGQWIGAGANDGNISSTAAAGTYVYTLNLSALVPGGGSLSLQYAGDNNVVWTITGGTLSGATSCTTNDCFSSNNGAPRSISGTFGAASILTATVTNTAVGPTGLMVVGTASNVPEPSTYAMLGLGGAAMLFARLRRK